MKRPAVSPYPTTIFHWILILLLPVLLFSGQPQVSQAAPEKLLTSALFEDIGAGLTGVNGSSAAWGDYDHDGDLDLVVSGRNYLLGGNFSKIYRNDGGVFTDISAGLTNVYLCSAAWGDYDNDGSLDVLLCGGTGPVPDSGNTKIYHNDGGVFTDIEAELPGVTSGSAAWGDFDNDGDLDLVLSGGTYDFSRIARIYRNDGGDFTDIVAGLTGVTASSAAWGDYDKDGDLDLLLSGGSASGNLTILYRNDEGVFSDSGAGLPGVSAGSAAWGDYDNDGDLDLVLSGNLSSNSRTTKIYRNTNGSFTDIGAGLIWLGSSSAAWGDCDNDGDLDLVLSGDAGTGHWSKIYRNDSAIFTDIEAGLPGVDAGSTIWGDYDNDNDLDLLLSGYTNEFTLIAKIYRNNTTGANSAPNVPGGLQNMAAGRTFTLSWNASTDNQTPTGGLTYNIRAGTTPGGEQIVSPAANPASGLRHLAAMGNGQSGTTFVLKNLPPGTYYWSVQAIDSAFAGSPFAIESSFEIGPPPAAFAKTAPVDASSGMPSSLTLTWGASAGATAYEYCYHTTATCLEGGSGPGYWINAGSSLSVTLSGLNFNTLYTWQVRAVNAGGITYANASGGPTGGWWNFLTSLFEKTGMELPGVIFNTAAWGDYDNDGDLDLLLSGDTGGTPITKIYRNDGSGFTGLTAGLPEVWAGSAAWGDYDNDGDLDILLTGNVGSGYLARIYRNDGGIFSDIGAGLSGVQYSSAAWGDYDNDGSLDLVISGDSGAGYISKIYHNNGGVFSDIGAGLIGVYESATAWGDYDNDGDLDLALSGYTGSVVITRIYRNDSGVFTDIEAGLSGMGAGSVAWGDYDNDGSLDLAVCGAIPPATGQAKIYHNNGGVFTSIGAGLTGVFWGSALWGDYDNDGDIDLLLSGYIEEGTSVFTAIYRNNAGSFSPTPAGLPDTGFSAAAWGDYDNDGRLDLLLAGEDPFGVYFAHIYRSHAAAANTAPNAPGGLQAVVNGQNVTLSWNTAGDSQTPSGGLTYNVRAGTTPGGSQIVSPMANSATGFRRLPAMGNGQTGTSFLIKNLPYGRYDWSVQAVDSAFAGSAFATEGSFTIGYTISGLVTKSDGLTPLSDVTVTAAPGGRSAVTAPDSSYSIAGLPAGTYTVTPTRPGYNFAPVNRTVVLGADQTGINFAEGTYCVSGRITRSDGVTGISGLMVHIGPTAIITSMDGSYILCGLQSGAYTLTPPATGIWLPASRSVNLGGGNGNATGQDFREAYKISGKVTQANGTTPISGVTLTTQPGGRSAISAPNGSYTIDGLATNTYTVTPALAGYHFAPASLPVIVGPDGSEIDFLEGTYCASGRVTLSDGNTALSEVTLHLGANTALSAADGSFAFCGLAAGDYNLSASKTGFFFLPASRSINLGGGAGSATNQNFQEAYKISGRVTLAGAAGPAGFAGLRIVALPVLAGQLPTVTYSALTAANGTYTIQGLPAGTYLVLPYADIAGLRSTPAAYSRTVGPDRNGADFAARYPTYGPLTRR